MTRNRKLANEIREWLLSHDMWVDVTIYFDGVAYSTSDKENKHFAYNDPNTLFEYEDDPRRHFEYVNPEHILSMSFEGDLYYLLNCEWEWQKNWYEEFRSIFKRNGVYYELGNSWNLSCYDVYELKNFVQERKSV